MKVVVPGGSGQVGTILARAFAAGGHEVVVLSRRPAPAPWRVVGWDGRTLGPWAAEFDGADAVINLAGRSVQLPVRPPPTAGHPRLAGRSTRAVGRAIRQADRPPRVWLQMSTATIYAHRFDAPNDEATGGLGGSDQTPRPRGGSASRWRKALGGGGRRGPIRRAPGTSCSARR